MSETTITFSHPTVSQFLGDLQIVTGANSVYWTYGLNAQTYPTYGGEVVQILSAYVGDITFEGEVRTYAELQQIYRWFLTYMRVASQGALGTKFDENPVTCQIPSRGWTLQIKPKSLPQYRLATDVVAPPWRFQAQIVDAPNEFESATFDAATAVAGFNFTGTTALSQIGFDPNNPFVNPLPHKSTKESEAILKRFSDGLSSQFSAIIQSYSTGDLSDLTSAFLATPSTAFGNSFFYGTAPTKPGKGGKK